MKALTLTMIVCSIIYASSIVAKSHTSISLILNHNSETVKAYALLEK